MFSSSALAHKGPGLFNKDSGFFTELSVGGAYASRFDEDYQALGIFELGIGYHTASPFAFFLSYNRMFTELEEGKQVTDKANSIRVGSYIKLYNHDGLFNISGTLGGGLAKAEHQKTTGWTKSDNWFELIVGFTGEYKIFEQLYLSGKYAYIIGILDGISDNVMMATISGYQITLGAKYYF